MDTFLNDDGPFIILNSEYEIQMEEYETERASLWVVEGDIIRPSTNISIQQKLSPGVYDVNISRDYGIYCKKVNIKSDELIVFSDSIVTNLIQEINLFWDKKDLYKDNKLIHKRGILLEGYPGTGKTSIISLLAEEIIKRNGIVFNISSANNLSIYIDFITNSFRLIEPETPIISIIEDIDKFGGEDTLLYFLDGKNNIDHHVVIATTNNTQDIPDAFLRPSRIDLRIEIPLPSEKIRREFFSKKNLNEEEVNILVEKTDELSLADLKEIYITTFLLGYTIEESLEKVINIRAKRNYKSKNLSKNKLGL